ncbi:MAG: hypothetical protein M1831_000966 [Alyxoria varia]|nr:MAG: hypothetical protein M1831_000966 [Alyxoria varia]
MFGFRPTRSVFLNRFVDLPRLSGSTSRPTIRGYKGWTKYDGRGSWKRPSTVSRPRLAEFEEGVENYIPGGYHPRHKGDKFNGRYVVITKLGYGLDSTVWLARDKDERRYVVLKVFISQRPPMELQFDDLERLTSSEAGRKHLVQPLDYFIHSGPNGKHVCLVLAFAGPSLSSKLEQRYHVNRFPLSAPVAWMFAKQITEAVGHIHSKGLAHGDLNPDQICISVSIAHKDGSYLSFARQNKFKHRFPDADQDCAYLRHIRDPPLSPPRYMLENSYLPIVTTEHLQCKLMYLGKKHLFWNHGEWAREDNSPSQVVPSRVWKSPVKTPLLFKAPEQLMDSERLMKRWPFGYSTISFGVQADIWSLGCLFYTLVVGFPPWCLTGFEAPVEDALRQMACCMTGKDQTNPRQIFVRGKDRFDGRLRKDLTRAYKSCRRQMNIHEYANEYWGDCGNCAPPDDDMVKLDELHGNRQFTDREIDLLGHLLETMMNPKAEERPSAQKILDHSFFARALRGRSVAS